MSANQRVEFNEMIDAYIAGAIKISVDGMVSLVIKEMNLHPSASSLFDYIRRRRNET